MWGCYSSSWLLSLRPTLHYMDIVYNGVILMSEDLEI